MAPNHATLQERIKRLARGDKSAVPLAGRISKPYDSLLKVVEKAWTEYLRLGFEDEVCKHVEHNAWSSPPTKEQVMGFLLHAVASGKGQLGSGLRTSTLKKYVRTLNRLVEDKLGQAKRLNRGDMGELYSFVDVECVEYGANQKIREKPLATPAVVRTMLQFLWTSDEFDYRHPSERLQVLLLLLLFLFLGLRPGEVIESGAYVKSNKGLKWKDVEFFVSLENGRRRIAANIQIRNRKGGRGDGMKAISMILLEDPKQPELYPIA
ncbi:hypothetical protein BST61_g5324 [Cercospora zeina]